MLSLKYNKGYIPYCPCEICIWRRDICGSTGRPGVTSQSGVTSRPGTTEYYVDIGTPGFIIEYRLDENIAMVAHDTNFSPVKLDKLKKNLETSLNLKADLYLDMVNTKIETSGTPQTEQESWCTIS